MNSKSVADDVTNGSTPAPALPKVGWDPVDHMSHLLVFMAPFMSELERLDHYWEAGLDRSMEDRPYHQLADVTLMTVSALVEHCRKQHLFLHFQTDGISEAIVWNYFAAQLKFRTQAVNELAKVFEASRLPEDHGGVLKEELQNLVLIESILDKMERAGWNDKAEELAGVYPAPSEALQFA